MPPATSTNWQTPDAGGVAARGRRSSRVLAAGVGLLTVTGLLTYAVLWLRPPQAAKLLVWTASYDDTRTIPPNATGRIGATRIHELGRSGARGHSTSDPQPMTLTRGDIARQLNELADFRGPSAVLVFAAHGGCDANGPFLFPDDAGPEPDHRIRVKAILDAVTKMPAKCRKLLLFDATGPPAIPAHGQFLNDFARGLATLDADIAAIPNLVVFSSSAPDERSWPAVERGTSAFLHFVKRGMQGDADADGDGRLNAAELIRYATSRTGNWARDHHAARQTPTAYPTGAESDRRAADISLSLVSGPAPADPLPTPFAPPAEWDDAWKRYRELDSDPFHPTAYAPELWREYGAWLLRYEQLLAADATDSAGNALQTAERIRSQLLGRRALEVSPQTLQLPFALGSAAKPEAAAREAVEALGRAAEPDRPKAWADAFARLGGDSTATRLALGRALLSWVADDPLTRLSTAKPLLAQVCEPFTLKPAELHFLTALTRDLPPAALSTAAGPVIQRVLRLRLRAEEVATGSRAEVVRRWIEEDIGIADSFRRKAEDLLFASDPENWLRAAEYARQAEDGYSRAAATADIVRAAEATWQRAIPQLADLGEWLADGPRRASLPDRLAAEATLRDTEAAWKNAYLLAARCRGGTGTQQVADLVSMTKAVADAVEALRAAHAKAVVALLAEKAKLETRFEFARWWAAAESALSVPGGDRQKELLVEFRRASRQLTVMEGESLEEPPADVTREQARDHARRRGLLHLARLGMPDTGNPSVAFQFDRFAQLADATEVLTTASGQLAKRFVAVRDGSANDPNLADADRFARVSVLPTVGDTANRYRRARAADLLAWHATRTEADYWASGPDAAPYFHVAAAALRTDAGKLSSRPPVAKTQPDGFPFVLKIPAKVIVTDEPSPRFRCELTAPNASGFGPGFVVFHDTTETRTREVRATDVTTPDAVVVPIPPRSDKLPLPTEPVMEPSTVRLVGYFRGRTVERPVAVERYPVPHVTAVRRPLGEDASVAVRADPALRNRYGVGSGFLHFVVDATGSMRGDPDVPGDGGRYAVILASLENVLKRIPAGVSVAVSAFGHRTGPEAEGRFETLLPFTAWTFEPEKQTGEVLAKLKALEPWDESPVVRAVFRAKATLKDRTPGVTAVILFGDGVDTKFADDAEGNPKKKSVKDAVRAGFSSDTAALHVVAVPVTDPAEKAAQDNFRVVTECKPAGLFLTPDQSDKLVDWIRSATAPRITCDLANPVPERSRQLLTGSEAGDNWLSPTAGPGRYAVRAKLGNAVVESEIDLRSGERLLLVLVEGKGSPRFAPLDFAAEVPAASRKTLPGWTAAVPKQRLLETGGLELKWLADRNLDSFTVAAPARIADVWFELSPAVPRPVAVRWVVEPGWPAPTWLLSTRNWPKDGPNGVPPKLTAWWSDVAPFAPTVTWKPDGIPVVDHPAVSVGDTRIESVTLEDHEVETKPDARQRKKCLVVRLKFPTSDTVFARPTGVAPTGSETRVYQTAGKTTCLFWWDDTAAAAKGVTGFELISLSAAKKSAVVAEMPTLPPPTAAAPSPSPAPR